MAKKILADVRVSNNTTSMDKNTIRDINGVSADSSGNVNYPYYTKEYLDKVIKTLPVSRVGTMDYLPMNINGSYEGATTFYDSRHILPVILENDGTLVYLRPGTNGSTEGYYYCYVSNARDTSDLTPVLTNEKYVPSFFTASHKLLDFVGTKGSELLFMLTNNGTNDTYTIALTNGTMNSVTHQYIEFNRTLMPNTTPQYAHIVGTLIYIWCVDSINTSDPLTISLYTMAVDGVRNGSTSTLQRVTGFSGSTITGAAVTASNNIRLAQKMVSTTSSDNPLFLADAASNIYPYPQNDDGLIQAVSNDAGTSIRVAIFHAYAVIAATATTLQRNWGLSFTYNTSTKAYALDKAAGSITATTVNSTITINDPYNVQMENINGFPSSSQGNVPTIFQTKDGMVLSTIARYITSPQHKISRAKISSFTDAYSNLNLSTRVLNSQTVKYIDPIYGSPIGENLINPVYCGNGVIINCSGTTNGVTYGFDNKVQTAISGPTTYSYKSVVTGGTINGFAPQSNRVLLDNSSNIFVGTTCEITLNGSTTTIGGGSFIEGFSKANNAMYIPSSQTWTPETYTLSSPTLLTNLKNSAISGVSGYTGNITKSIIVLYYIRGSANKSYACTTFTTDTQNAYCIITEVSTTTSGTIYNINSLTATSNRLVQVASQAISLDYTYIKRMGGLVKAEYDTFYYLGMPALINVGTPSNATFRSFICKVDKSTGLITGNIRAITEQYVSSGGGSYCAGVIPGIGFGLYENGSITDYLTKLVFNSYGTTSAQLDALIAGTATPLQKVVVASQEVPQGFNVYFSQEVPALINGSYYKLPPTSIDLTTIDSSPANKTFYIYVYVVENICKYVISTTKLTEELNRIYIGTILTGTTNITSIESEKVTRFLTYRVSTTKRGSAIPTSTGVPSGTGTRWH